MLLKYAQYQAPTGQTGTGTTQTGTGYAFNISSVPAFNPTLFQVRPDIINHFNQLAGFINQQLIKLSNNRVNFTNTYLTPSVSSSEFSNDLKHFMDLAKWVYTTITNKSGPYTIQGLITYANNLITNVRARSFIDTNARDKMVVYGQNMLALLRP